MRILANILNIVMQLVKPIYFSLNRADLVQFLQSETFGDLSIPRETFCLLFMYGKFWLDSFIFVLQSL